MPTIQSPLRVGLAGCGRIAQMFHLKILASLPGVRLTALADPDPKNLAAAKALAKSAATYTDEQELLGCSDIDAVVVCLPTGLHARAAVRVFEAGKHLYLEKPLAISHEEGERVIAAWRASGKLGMIGFNFRFHPLFEAARQLLQDGTLGRVLAVRANFSSALRNKPDWKSHRQAGGSVLLDLASHLVDRACFLFQQDVQQVHAVIQSIRSEHDTACMTVVLKNGILFQGFVCSHSIDEDSLEITGEKGKLSFDRYRNSQIEITPPVAYAGRLESVRRGVRFASSLPRRVWDVLTPRQDPSFRRALEHFASAIRAGKAVSPDLEDGQRSLEVILAAEESAHSGRVVTLEGAACESAAAE